MRSTPATVLCFAPAWLGDAVLALPALRLLGAAGVQVDVVARGGSARVFEAAAGVRRVHTTAGRRRGTRLRDAWRSRAARYDAALVLTRSHSSALAARLSGARRRVGETAEGRGVWLTDTATPAGRDVHLSLAYQRLALLTLRALGIAAPPTDGASQDAALPVGLYAAPHLVARPEEREAARTLLREIGVRQAPPPLVVSPGARFGPAKRYPPERFARAAAQLGRDLGCDVLLVGEVSDAPSTAAVRAELSGALDVTGRTTLGSLIGVLAECSGVLSNDSGTMHLAAALGVPVVGVFGSSNPLWTRPLGARAGFVVEPVFCAPCYAPTCPLDFACMLRIAPERLVEAFHSARGRRESDWSAASPGL